MGRASRIKRERHQALSQDPLRRQLQGLDRGSVVRLLCTALCSPTAAHRVAALSNALSTTLSLKGRQGRPVTLEELQPIVVAAHQAEPRLDSLTDWVPMDPRLNVRFRWQDRLYRVHPSDLERPLSVLRKAELVSAVIDEGLVPDLGFGLADFMDVGLTYMDTSAERLVPAWAEGPPTDPNAPARVTSGEVEAYASLISPAQLLDHCSNPGAARRALDWATVPASSVSGTDDDPLYRFGHALCIRLDDGTVFPMPPSACCAAVEQATTELATTAVASRPELGQRFRQTAVRAVARLIGALGFPVAGPVSGPGGGGATQVFHVAERACLAVEVVTPLAPQANGEGAAADRLTALSPGQVWSLGGGAGLQVHRDTRIARLLVVVAPAHVMVPSFGGVAGMSLEDLEWVTSAVQESPDDLWWFVRDLGEQPGIRRLMSFEAIDVFETWRANKHIVNAGLDYAGVMIPPHQGTVEYERGSELLPVEAALLACSLPPLRSFDHVRRGDDGDAFVFARRNGIGVRVMPGEMPVCIMLEMPRYPGETGLFVESVGNGMAWKLAHMPSLLWLRERFALEGLTVFFDWQDRLDRPACTGATASRMTIALSSAGYETCIRDAVGFESELVLAMADGLARTTGVDAADADIQAFVQGWHRASPGIRIDELAVAQREPRPPVPVVLSLAAQRRAERELRRALAAARAPTGTRQGAAAVEFESETIHPLLLSMLHDAFDRFERAALLNFALRQYDLAHAARSVRERELSLRHRFPSFYGDPVASSRVLVEESQQLVKAQAILIEEMLVHPPAGNLEPDRVEWEELLALAVLLHESGRRSEDVHVGLVRLEIELTDQYEIEMRRLEGAQLIDLDAFSAAYAAATHIGPSLPWIGEAVNDEADPESADLGDLAAIDNTLLTIMGFHLRTITGVLFVLRSWPVDPDSGSASYWGSVDEVVQFCQDGLTGVPAEEIRGALDRLVLKATALGPGPLEHWEQERRVARLTTRPLVERPDGRLAVMPWAIESTLSVYMRYLGDGRLPWPRSRTPPNVLKAIEAYRARRNTALEDEVFKIARAAGYPARKRVKKARSIGLDHLSGEIDVLVAVRATCTIWVLEVKDPQEAFSSQLMRDDVRDFLGHGSKKGYVSRLLGKGADIKQDASAVALSLLAGDDCRWEVSCAVVTRRPVPAAFAGCALPFVTVEHVLELLARSGTRPIR